MTTGNQIILQYLTSVPAWYLATSVDGQPHVRPFSFAAEQDGKIWFCTATHQRRVGGACRQPAVRGHVVVARPRLAHPARQGGFGRPRERRDAARGIRAPGKPWRELRRSGRSRARVLLRRRASGLDLQTTTNGSPSSCSPFARAACAGQPAPPSDPAPPLCQTKIDTSLCLPNVQAELPLIGRLGGSSAPGGPVTLRSARRDLARQAGTARAVGGLTDSETVMDKTDPGPHGLGQNRPDSGPSRRDAQEGRAFPQAGGLRF